MFSVDFSTRHFQPAQVSDEEEAEAAGAAEGLRESAGGLGPGLHGGSGCKSSQESQHIVKMQLDVSERKKKIIIIKIQQHDDK